MAARIGRHASTVLVLFNGEPITGITEITIEGVARTVDVTANDSAGYSESIHAGNRTQAILRTRTSPDDPPTLIDQPGARVVRRTFEAGMIEEEIRLTDRTVIIDREREKLTRIENGEARFGNACPQWRPLPWRCMPHIIRQGGSDAFRISPDERTFDVEPVVEDLNFAALALIATDRRGHAATMLLDVLPPCGAVDPLIAAGAVPSPEWEGDRQRCMSAQAMGVADPAHALHIAAWRLVRRAAVELLFGAERPETPCVHGTCIDALTNVVRHITGDDDGITADEILAAASPGRRGWARAQVCVTCACTGHVFTRIKAEDRTLSAIGTSAVSRVVFDGYRPIVGGFVRVNDHGRAETCGAGDRGVIGRVLAVDMGARTVDVELERGFVGTHIVHVPPEMLAPDDGGDDARARTQAVREIVQQIREGGGDMMISPTGGEGFSFTLRATEPNGDTWAVDTCPRCRGIGELNG